jgi:uncharacterized protein YndB with AHSA1/START domain
MSGAMKKATGRVNGLDLIVTRTFRAPIEDVWASCTESARTERWFGKWEGEAKVGGEIRILMVFEKPDAWTTGTIDKCDAPNHLVLTTRSDFGTKTLEIKLRADGETTHLEFVHHLKDHKMVGELGAGWEYYFDNLVASRDGSEMPKFDDYYPSMKEHFVKQVT